MVSHESLTEKKASSRLQSLTVNKYTRLRSFKELLFSEDSGTSLVSESATCRDDLDGRARRL